MNGVTELKNLLRQKTWDKDVDTFLEAVRERIKAAFAKARQETGGKKRIRFFLR